MVRQRHEGLVHVAAGDRCRITLDGEFDVSNSDAILDAVRSALAHPAPVIEVDLGATTLLSSAAIAELLQAASLAERQARRLEVVAVSPEVARTLGVLGVDRLLGMTSDDDDA